VGGELSTVSSYLVIRVDPNLFSKGISMGKLKSLLIDTNEQDRRVLETIKPKVHILMCNGKPVDTYVDRMTAEYEMHLCIQGDAQELGQSNSYEIVTLPLQTHRMD